MSRYTTFAVVVLLTIGFTIAGLTVEPLLLWAALAAGAVAAVGVRDLTQRSHSLLRNYPVLGHMRWLFEGIRPEIRQYLIEDDQSQVPFSREQRAIVYQRAKGELDKRPFGTRLDVYDAGYAWLTHATVPAAVPNPDFRCTIGHAHARQPYHASLYNISAMSFGALSANAILALNSGAKMGNFAHDTGEGSISPYHRRYGGDLIWEIGSGYFGCRDGDGRFDAARFAEQAGDPQVKMIELKLSQGAKPGHGGVLPAAKITPEIAATRGIPMGRDCESPARHSAFSTPVEMMEFLARLRELSEGKPVGFKLCVGHRWEFMAMVKAMLETGVVPDFIVVDGAEGGTGAAPLEFANHMGSPMLEGLTFVRNTLIGAGLRDQVRIGAAGKLVTGFDLAFAFAMGADWCNSGRGFMFAVGCIQAQACHTNRCPTGVATQDPLRQRALDVADKAERVRNFHRGTLVALAELTAAAGAEHPGELSPAHINLRQKSGEVLSADEAFPRLEIGELLDGTDRADYARDWRMASAEAFRPIVG